MDFDDEMIERNFWLKTDLKFRFFTSYIVTYEPLKVNTFLPAPEHFSFVTLSHKKYRKQFYSFAKRD